MFKHLPAALLAALAITPLATAQVVESQAQAARNAQQWMVWGGELRFNWNRDLMGDLGFTVSPAKDRLDVRDEPHVERIALREAAGLEIRVENSSDFAGFAGGRLQSRGGFRLTGENLDIDLSNLVLRPSPKHPFQLDVISADGKAWFYIDRLMYKLEGGDVPQMNVRAMDLRIAPELAAALGNRAYAGWVVAGLEMYARIATPGAVIARPKGSSRWHGSPAPNGGVYEVDVFMSSFNLQYTRKQNAADGPGGQNTGLVVFTPSSTLRNNRGTGSADESNLGNPLIATVAGDPLGTSTARYAADVPWWQKFSGNFAPHGNDQHPYLIWNLYRVDSTGRIEQIGRSGVKHAWLTTNSPCDVNPGNNHILGRGCVDTYGTGNNDAITDLGPRNEILPFTGQWGRCGSVYDADCNGARDTSSPCVNVGGTDCSNYAFRMPVIEQFIDTSLNPGATYFAESWYIVRDDINIQNTMQSLPITFNWTGSAWNSMNGTPLRLGAALGRWVAPDTTAPNERSTDIKTGDGSLRVALRVNDLGGGQYRYDYAVMNFDFARAVTQGAEPNLRVLRNNGFNRFELPFPEDAELISTEFADGDLDSANNWTLSRVGSSLVWQAAGTPTAPNNPLNWGVMFRFSLTTTQAPQAGSGSLGVAEPGTPASVRVDTLVPGAAAPSPDALFSNGFETAL
ncbi:hypothetical protein [Aquimonas voraii]|uniref:Uncharacterized protein n=1 Tax=Aquimonas voraii TaxID=265719 RepID=A0A1G6T5K1_9GAMM|nr:hypothetical protein [Aquimonas voraii]SDD24164.1 hypothetical protein SAMN04488509_101883 [Aquimonas voraii]